MSKQPGTRKKHPVLVALLVFLVLLLLLVGSAAGVGYFILKSEATGATRDSMPVHVEIPKGATSADIAGILEDEGVIGNRLIFRAYLKYVVKVPVTFQYGEFTLLPDAGYERIVRDLQATAQREATVDVTFPEGYNAFQMGEVLEKAGLCTQKEFLDAVNTHSFDVSFFKEISQNPLKLVRLDGFLFPDTYQFYADATVDDIILAMLQNFEKKAMTDEHKKLLADSGYALEQWVIFASIIQREAANVEEMYNVSSVFYNRMQKNSGYPKLESCTTNNYIRDYLQPQYGGKAPQEELDAYDTYGTPGLPVGAIANPGADALDAALKPNDTPYYFFVTDIEFTHYYGKTFAEHESNIQKALAVNKKHGKNGL